MIEYNTKQVNQIVKTIICDGCRKVHMSSMDGDSWASCMKTDGNVTLEMHSCCPDCYKIVRKKLSEDFNLAATRFYRRMYEDSIV